MNRIVLELTRVHFVKTTREIGQDEIYLMGKALDGIGVPEDIEKRNIDKFKNGEVRAYASPMVLHSYKDSQSTTCP